jgi:hypothetical protein
MRQRAKLATDAGFFVCGESCILDLKKKEAAEAASRLVTESDVYSSTKIPFFAQISLRIFGHT